MRRLTVLFLLVAACSDPAPTALAIVANAPGTLTPGPERLVIALVAEDTTSLASPDRPAVATITAPDGSMTQVGTDFVWTIPDVRGVYTALVEFDQVGVWQVSLVADDIESLSVPVAVDAISLVPGVGDPAVRSVTPTAADAPLEAITSDPHPDPELYEVSLDAALDEGRTVVVAFATPAFCQTASCGPTVDVVKAVKADHPDVRFLHVEVYANLDAERFEDLELVPAISEWALPSEPWVFVISADGIIRAAFEGALSETELDAALEG